MRQSGRILAKRGYLARVWHAQLRPSEYHPGYRAETAFDLFLLSGLDRRWVLPALERAKAVWWTSFRLNQSWIWGESEEDTLSRVDAMVLAEKQRTREEALRRALGRDLTREEQVEIAEAAATKGMDSIRRAWRRLAGMDQTAAVERAKTSLTFAHACVSGFLSGYREGKSREIRAWLRERPEELHTWPEVDVEEAQRTLQALELEDEQSISHWMRADSWTNLTLQTNENRSKIDHLLHMADTALEQASQSAAATQSRIQQRGGQAAQPITDTLQSATSLLSAARKSLKSIDTDKILHTTDQSISSIRSNANIQSAKSITSNITSKVDLTAAKSNLNSSYNAIKQAFLTNDSSAIQSAIQQSATNLKSRILSPIRQTAASVKSTLQQAATQEIPEEPSKKRQSLADTASFLSTWATDTAISSLNLPQTHKITSSAATHQVDASAKIGRSAHPHTLSPP